MERYFYTSNAGRPYPLRGGASVLFEPTGQIAGSWEGALAVADGNRAKDLAAYGPPIEEISRKRYEEIKKKAEKTRRDYIDMSSLQGTAVHQPAPEAAAHAAPELPEAADALSFGEADPPRAKP